jgi:hypothetical protein
MITAVLYNIGGNFPLSFDNQVSETVYPERTDPDLKYFVPYEPYTVRDYDPRLEIYTKHQTPKSDTHPDYPIYGQWLIEHEYTKRSQDDVFLSIENARRIANATLIDNDLYFMALGVTIKKQNNELLTDEETQISLSIVDIHNKLMQNYTNEANLKTAWLNNQNINIDEGWQEKS